ncbi:TIGR01777 family protein [Phytoactinopolyspora alkaliphila]|uniref:TIGR01777 family protein n=1 Tax=Phytoactinopolyspora alkaliphila TaxID=1783498 RepID=A0A6N9YNK4_9ACTN|nr:TIGR01777 family protein [Phytoactinopolyspora alkaliphila]
MRVAISGSSGLIGTALSESLEADGHEVLRLVRRPTAGAGEIPWNPSVGDVDPALLEGLDAVVNLSGAGIGDHRWTKAYKETLRNSRIRTTAILANALARLDDPPRVFLSASGVNYYGMDRGAEVLTEDSEPGQGFLPQLCQDWEAATDTAKAAGIAVCHTRFGLALDRRGGSLGQMLPVFRAGLGGPLAGGHQYWSFISMPDVVAALRFLIEQPGSVGIYNLTSPEPVTNGEFTRVLAHQLRRPAILPVPTVALRVALGEIAATIAGSLRMVPTRLVAAGFEFRHPTARSAIAAALEA